MTVVRFLLVWDAYTLLLALVAYEYLITFQQEIDTVWKRKLNTTSLLLLGVRWVMLALTIFNFILMSKSELVSGRSSEAVYDLSAGLAFP